MSEHAVPAPIAAEVWAWRDRVVAALRADYDMAMDKASAMAAWVSRQPGVVMSSMAVHEARARRDYWHEFYAGDGSADDARWLAGRARILSPSPASARGTMSARRTD